MTRDTNRHGAETAKAPSAMVDEELQSAKLVLSGTPESITFAALGLEDMADTDYRAWIAGEFASVAYIDESTIAATGFDIVDGATTEVAHIFVHGKTATRKRF